MALKIAVSKAFSWVPLVTPGSLPPCDLEAESTEYFFTTSLKAVPFLSSATALFASSTFLVRTTSRSRLSGWAKRLLFLL